MNHVVIPHEMLGIADALNEAIGGDIDSRAFTHTELLEEHFGIPSYAEALDEVDLWHKVNVWSNAPVAMRSKSHTTKDLVDLVANDEELHEFVIEYLVGTCPVNGRAHRRETLENGPDERTVQLMCALRENHRLDKEV